MRVLSYNNIADDLENRHDNHDYNNRRPSDIFLKSIVTVTYSEIADSPRSDCSRHCRKSKQTYRRAIEGMPSFRYTLNIIASGDSPIAFDASITPDGISRSAL